LQALRAQYQGSNKELNNKVEELGQHIDKQGDLIVAVQNELDAVKSVQKHILKADPLAGYFNEDGTPKKQIDIFPTRHRNADGIFYQSGRRATALGEGQSFEDIANLYNIDIKELRRFNELESGEEKDLPKGCFVYLEPKANTVSGENGPHTVAAGEDMHSISQRYGIKLSKLYQRNYLKKGEEPVAGEFIFLNESADKKPLIRTTLDETGSVSTEGDRFGGGGSK
jgi:LysM repeat protein